MTDAGTPLSPWAVSYLYAQAIAGRAAVSGQALVVLARAISAEAIKIGLVPPPQAAAGVTVSDPHLFGQVSLGRLVEKRLNTAIAIVELVNPALGYAPTGGEPGFHDYCLLMDALAIGGASPADMLADPQIRASADQAAAAWNTLLTEARNAAMGAMMQVLPRDGDLRTMLAPRLTALAPQVDDLLRARAAAEQ